MCAVNTLGGFLFLKESYAPVILTARKQALESKDESNKKDASVDDTSYSRKEYHIANEDPRPFRTRLGQSMLRPLRILFTQPIVLVMAIYQAILFGTMYSLYTNFEKIYGSVYGMNTTQVGLTYLGPGIGFLIAVRLLVPRIDSIYNRLTARNHGIPQPEYRLPIANVGAILLPVGLFWFGWSVEKGVHWIVPILGTLVYGIGLVAIQNTAQNYYIDAFSQYAASAIAAGAVFRSLVGGVVPLGAGGLFEKLGYGWGVSVFAFLHLALSPAPMIFFWYGRGLRERFAIDL